MLDKRSISKKSLGEITIILRRPPKVLPEISYLASAFVWVFDGAVGVALVEADPEGDRALDVQVEVAALQLHSPLLQQQEPFLSILSSAIKTTRVFPSSDFKHGLSVDKQGSQNFLEFLFVDPVNISVSFGASELQFQNLLLHLSRSLVHALSFLSHRLWWGNRLVRCAHRAAWNERASKVEQLTLFFFLLLLSCSLLLFYLFTLNSTYYLVFLPYLLL